MDAFFPPSLTVRRRGHAFRFDGGGWGERRKPPQKVEWLPDGCVLSQNGLF